MTIQSNKRKALIGFYLLLILIAYLPSIAQSDSSAYSFSRENDPEYKAERRRWKEEMHRCPPDVNYRIIDRENIRAIRQQKSLAKQRGELLDNTNTAGPIGSVNLRGEWLERGSLNLAGRMHTDDVDFVDNLIYAGSAGGNVWRGTLDGENWKSLNDPIQFRDIRTVKVIRFGSTKRILVATNPEGVYYTDNEGVDWHRAIGLENPSNWGSIKRMAVANNDEHTIYVLAGEWNDEHWRNAVVLYRSTDRGETFESISMNLLEVDKCDIWAAKYNGDAVYFMQKDTIFHVQNNGVLNKLCIIKDLNGVNVGSCYLRGCDLQSSTRLVAAIKIAGEDGFNFLLSDDMGENWDANGFINKNLFAGNSYEVSAFNPSVFYFGDVEFYYSMNSGFEWTQTNNWWEYYDNIEHKLHADIPGIHSFITPQGDELLLINTDGGLFKSYDQGKTVQNISLSKLNVSQYYSTYSYKPNPDKIFAGAQDQGFQRSNTSVDGNFIFEQTISGDYGHLTSSNGGDDLWCVYPGFAMYYKGLANENIENSLSWNFVGDGLWMPPITADPKSPKSAYVARGGSNGSNITYLSVYKNEINASVLPYDFSQAGGGSVPSAIEFSPINSNYMYVATNDGYFYYSTDGGSNWDYNTVDRLPESHYFYGTAILPSAKTLGRVIVGGSGYYNSPVVVTNDNGLTFFAMGEGLPHSLVYGLAQSEDEELIFAATEVGPYVYVLKDNYWYPLYAANTPEQTYWSVEYIPSIKTARFGTYGRGIWDFKVLEYSNVKDETTSKANAVSIECSPNPAADAVEIIINSAKECNGELNIYDYEGKLIATLYKGELRLGDTHLNWNCLSTTGRSLPDGAYLVVWRSDGLSYFRKLVLTK